MAAPAISLQNPAGITSVDPPADRAGTGQSFAAISAARVRFSSSRERARTARTSAS